MGQILIQWMILTQKSRQWSYNKEKTGNHLKLNTKLKLVIAEHYTFMASNTIFIVLGILDKHLKKTKLNKSTLPPGSCKTSLDTSPPPKLTSVHYKHISKI